MYLFVFLNDPNPAESIYGFLDGHRRSVVHILWELRCIDVLESENDPGMKLHHQASFPCRLGASESRLRLRGIRIVGMYIKKKLSYIDQIAHISLAPSARWCIHDNFAPQYKCCDIFRGFASVELGNFRVLASKIRDLIERFFAA